METQTYVRWFKDLGVDDVAEVGGKNASLGELYRELTPLGVNVPNGFAIVAGAYRDTLTASGAWDKLRTLMEGVDKSDVADLTASLRSLRVRKMGIVRERPRLLEAQHDVEFWCRYVLTREFDTKAGWELQNLLTVGP